MLEVWLKYWFRHAVESMLALLHIVPTTAAQFWRPSEATGILKFPPVALLVACMCTSHEVTHDAGHLQTVLQQY